MPWTSLLVILTGLVGCGAPATEDTGRCPQWYLDADGDGFGDPAVPSRIQCEQPEGYVGNPHDCDDSDPEIHPLATEVCDPDQVDEDCDGLADDEDDWAVGRRVEGWPDADGDGHASPEMTMRCALGPGWTDTPGRDCDDDDPAIHPDAPDPVDGVDQNCDGFDGPALTDDFELGEPDPGVWAELGSQAWVTRYFVHQGSYALLLGGDTVAETLSIDTTVCERVAWHWLGMSQIGQTIPDARFEYFDGADWVAIDAWQHDSGGTWEHRLGVVDDPAALHSDFRVRFRTVPSISGTLYVDQLQVGCYADTDDDGVADGIDCAPEEPLHWFDCGRCVDRDGDGRGSDCDLGPDCDDTDPSVHPHADDPVGDDIDSDCTGLDGPELFEDFEGGPHANVWQLTGPAEVKASEALSGTHALHLEPGGEAVSIPLDLSGCDDGVWWEYHVRQSGFTYQQAMQLAYQTAEGAWRTVDEWLMSSDGQGAHRLRSGAILEPAAARDGVRFRFTASGYVDGWSIDDVAIVCLVDSDGDLVADPRDCAPSDPEHWADCGECIDADEDGAGEGCDLGPDCDDGDASVGPHAADEDIDGFDRDCDGIDGPPTLYDDFEDGPDPTIWTSTQYVQPAPPIAENASSSLWFQNGWASIEAAPVDVSHCPALAWRARTLLSTLEAPDALNLEYWSGSAWIALDSWESSIAEPDWTSRTGRIELVGLPATALRIRLRGGPWAFGGHMYIDDLGIGCAAW